MGDTRILDSFCNFTEVLDYFKIKGQNIKTKWKNHRLDFLLIFMDSFLHRRFILYTVRGKGSDLIFFRKAGQLS